MADMADQTTCGHSVWDVIRNNKDDLAALHATRAPAWVPETEIRGTFSILLTCLVTLTACVYSAIHLNVPLKTTFWYALWTKMGWVLAALIAPELIVLVAILQFAAAWRLSSNLQKLQGETSGDKVNKQFDFDLRYAFFIVMGGVRFGTPTLARFMDLDDMKYLAEIQKLELEEIEDADDRPPWQLTPEGLLDLARLGHWVYISPACISDRSKADSLQKGLVVLQVSWMLTSCIARKWYGLPLTLLEVHTMVHVVCAFVMYGLWFRKPVDVRNPEVLDSNEGRSDVIAYLCHISLHPNEELQFLSRNKLEDASTCECGEADRVCRSRRPTEVYDPDSKQDRLEHKRWHAAVKAVRDVDPVRDRITPHEEFIVFRHRTGSLDNLASGFLVDSVTRTTAVWGTLSSFGIIPILYGGIHLTGWSSEFPSEPESLLWRISSISIMLTALVWPWSAMIDEDLLPGNKTIIRFKDAKFVRHSGSGRARNLVKRFVTRPIVYTFWGVATGVLLTSICGRFYLVIESFISLRAVPVGAYWVPSWLKYIPHV